MRTKVIDPGKNYIVTEVYDESWVNMVKKKIDKNAGNSISFKLVATSCNDPRLINARSGSTEVPKSALQRVYRPNASKKKINHNNVPPELLNTLAPEDFGIHANLECDTRDTLCNQIYGSPFLPEDKKLVTAVSLAKKSFDSLDGDCYFPRDGYDYEAHLVSLDSEHGKFISAGTSVSTELHLPAVEVEVLNALEDPEDYEELNDDFIPTEAAGVINEDRVIWGTWRPRISHIINQSSSPFDKVLASYNEDRIGELQEDNEQVMKGAIAKVEDFEDLLDEFIKEQNNSKIKITPRSWW